MRTSFPLGGVGLKQFYYFKGEIRQKGYIFKKSYNLRPGRCEDESHIFHLGNPHE